ncbi:MAG TPA: FecR domain-containing protein [Thermoanaerobaculia bacterium]|nr:FecR domain-containing protein [Thermoanaerobaculia bacterium]
MAAQKAVRPTKEWYSVSVETLRGLGLLLGLLVVAGIGFFGYRIWEKGSLERQAAQLLADDQELIQRLRNEERAKSFSAEYGAAVQSFEEAQALYSSQSYDKSIEKAKWSFNVLQSILDALALPGAAGQAQFISVQGEVEFRRGDSSDWQEARSRGSLRSGDYVRTSDNGSAEIMFLDGTLYTVRSNTQFVVAPPTSASGGPAEQAIEMEYGWVNLETAQRSSNVKTPGAVARVAQDSEAFVTVDKGSNQGRFGAYRGGMELESKGGLKREVNELQEVVQTGDLLSEPQALPGRPDPVEPADNLALDLDRTTRLVLSWQPVAGASRYALQVSRNHLFVDNVIDAENRIKTRATLGLRGEGTFQWRVAAYGPGGSLGPWSAPRKFRVASFQGSGGEKDNTPPQLDLEDVKSYGSIFIVAGRSEPGSRVEVNGELVKVEADGTFNKTIQLIKEGWSFIEVRARDGWGNETVRRHRVFVESS